jgi:hypothetical protein
VFFLMVRQIQDYIYGGPQQSLEERQRCSITMGAHAVGGFPHLHDLCHVPRPEELMVQTWGASSKPKKSEFFRGENEVWDNYLKNCNCSMENHRMD